MAEFDSAIEAILPSYEITRELGRGSYGVVLAGRHRQLGREVAIKQLSLGLVKSTSVRARFLAEAQVLAAIGHPHVVPIYDYVESDQNCLLVMERLNGGTVWDRFVDRGFTHPTACAVALVACSGLEGAHRHGVLHRDMKPENMLFGDGGVLKVADFGIAKVMGANDTLATPEGELLGTPAYMAPEQASGADIGPPTDVYAVGVMLYEMLSGRLPYPEDGGPLAIVLRHVNEDPTPLHDVAPSVPAELEEVVMRALARSPEDRYASAEEFGVAVAAAAAHSWGRHWMDGLSVNLSEPGPILDSARTGEAMSSLDHGDTRPVRPVVDLHVGGGANDVVLDNLMPLRQSPVDVPPFPSRRLWVAVAFAALALILGLLGVGSSAPSPDLARGVVSVAGHDPSQTGSLPLNLDTLVPIVLHRAPRGIGTPTSAVLSVSLGGVTVAHSTSAPFAQSTTGFVTKVDLSAGRYIVGGKVSSSLAIVGTRGTARDGFAVQTARSPFGTLMGVVTIILLLVVGAYIESLVRGLRRGRRLKNRAAIVGMAAVGAVAGVDIALWGWMIGATSPTVVGMVLPVVLAATASFIGGQAARQVGDRARARRQANRLVLVARRRTLAPQGTLAMATS